MFAARCCFAGCFKPEQQAAHQDFLRDIGQFMRSIAPLHLISAGTEGFFVEDKQSMLHYYNPGGVILRNLVGLGATLMTDTGEAQNHA